MEMPPVQFTHAQDGTRIAFVRYPGTSPVHFSVNTPGAPALSLRASLPAYAGYYEHYLRGKGGVYFDWRGTGASDRIDGSLRIDDLIADIEAVASAVDEPLDGHFVGRACFAGCLHAAQHIGRYRSIRLTGAALRAGENWQGLHNRPGWERDYPEHLRSLARSYFDVSPVEALRIAAAWEEGVPQRSWAAYLEAERGIDLTEVLSQLRVPTWVTAQRTADYEAAAVMAALLPNATFSTFEPRVTTPEAGDLEREAWDRHLGSRLGDPPSKRSRRPAAQRSRPVEVDELTQREREVLDLMALGDRNAQIARKLGVSERTVEHHVGSIFSKLGVENRVQAVNRVRGEANMA
jgi:DNA-binding NarL/FixJ family response regulator